jgi:hypothetical protein
MGNNRNKLQGATIKITSINSRTQGKYSSATNIIHPSSIKAAV